MTQKQSYFIVPDDILSDENNWLYILPIFAQIRLRTDFTGRCITAPVKLVQACGHKYHGRGKSKNHLEKTCEALNLLVQMDYFYDPVDAITGKQIDDFNDIAPTTFFEIHVNSEMCNVSAGGYCAIYPYLYEKLLAAYQNDSSVKLWRLMAVFCFISKHIWKRWEVNYDAANAVEYRKLRYENPEYYGATITHICEKLPNISGPTIQKAIDYLDKHEIIHRRKIGSLVSSNGNTIQLGSVFVLDKDGWDSEIEGAAIQCRKNREEWFCKVK